MGVIEWLVSLALVLAVAYGVKKFYGWKKYEKMAGRDGRIGTWIVGLFK